MTTPVEDVTTRILALAGESADKTISGGRLSELLKHAFPGFTLASYGAKNFRAFIREHLSGRLDEIGMVGTDIVYGLPGASPPSHAKPISSGGHITQEVMRVFRSPNARLELHANCETGLIHVVAKGTSAVEPWRRIDSASPEALLRLVRDFASELPPEYGLSLMPLLNEYPWWPKVSTYLQEKNLYSRFAAFKTKRLRVMLEAVLRGLGVKHAETPVPTTDEENKAHAPLPRTESTAAPSLPGRDELRDAIVRVVQNLPISELRNLKLPVGEVYDALTCRR